MYQSDTKDTLDRRWDLTVVTSFRTLISVKRTPSFINYYVTSSRKEKET